MGKRRKRKRYNPKPKTSREANAATNNELDISKHTIRNMQIAAIVFGALSVIGFVIFGAVYSQNRVLAIWFLFLPSSLALVVASCLQWHLLIIPAAAESEAGSETSTSGLLTPANDPTPQNPCGNIPADAMLVLLGNSGSWGTRFPQTIIKIHDTPMLTMDEIAGQVAISGKFYSADGRIVAQLDNNEFSINPNNYFRKKRPDKHSLIIWDQTGTEVLNVRFVNPNTIKVLGTIRHPLATVLISEKEGLFSNTICTGQAGGAHFAFD
jgi:hypothetical protein